MTYAVGTIVMVWNASFRTTELGSIENALQAYAIYNSWKVMFEVIGSREEWYDFQSQNLC